jgi:CheY-like chemotaxis protein
VSADGAEAPARGCRQAPDLIVLNLWMPAVDSFAVLTAVRAAGPPPIPVIAMPR